MTKQPAEWRSQLRPYERDDLERARALKEAAQENERITFKRIKDRCIKRLRKKAQEGE